jgi:hypothetical protein
LATGVSPLRAQTTTPPPAAQVFPLFADGSSGGITYVSQIKLFNTDATNPSVQCNVTQRNTAASFVGIHGDKYFADIFDAGDSPPALTTVFLNSFLPWEVLRSSAQGALKTGYATVSCSKALHTELLVSLFDARGNKLGETAVAPAQAGKSFEFLADRRNGTRLGISLVNDTGTPGLYTLIARDETRQVVDVIMNDIGAWSQVSFFVDEQLKLPTNFVGSIEVDGPSAASNYAVGLQFTGSVFATIPPVVHP